MSRYRVTVYRRTGMTMQTFNSDSLDHAMTLRHKHAGVKGVYKIELSAVIEEWTFDTGPQQY